MPKSDRAHPGPFIPEAAYSVNGLTMNVATTGDGPSMVLLHGFPDHWRSWRGLMEQLSDTFRLFAPDQRGYNLTSRPPDMSDYRPERLVADIAALIRTLGDEPVCLVAHDWGATIAFWLAIEQPHLLRCLTVLNGAHPYLLQDAIWDDPHQRAASRYIETLRSAAFEAWVAADSGERLAADWFGAELSSGRMSRDDLDACLSAWRQPGAWSAMLNWYRAAPFQIPDGSLPAPSDRWTNGLDYKVKVPTQVIWGERDTVFRPVLVDTLKQHVADLDLNFLPGAGHVPHRDEPETCAALIRKFAHRFL